MQVDGVGERPVIDSGGFPVVWLGQWGCTIGQDPDQGGTNCYGPGDVLSDADTGALYQIGSDWHLRQLGSQPGGWSAAPSPSPTMVDHFYYVDSGQIIEKTTYSDGSATFANTGMQSPLGDGAAAGDPYSLQQTTPQPGNTGGFNTPNPVGGYGPYATPDPPILTDRGTYVQGGELYDHQVDQYGNDYYQDLGPAPASSAPAAPTNQYAPPTVNSPRNTAPPVGSGAASTTMYPAAGVAVEPTAADGQRLSGQSAITRAAYQALYGANAAATWVQQHNAAIGAGASVAAPTVPTGSTTSTTGGAHPAGTGTGTGSGTHTGTGNTPAITATGNPTTFAHQLIAWLSRTDFISGVPNGILVAGAGTVFSMVSQRRRRS